VLLKQSDKREVSIFKVRPSRNGKLSTVNEEVLENSSGDMDESQRNMISMSPVNRISGAHSTSELGYLVTKITDNGAGISDKNMKSLFTTFKQKTRRGILGKDGIGIGLSTAKALTTSLGGAICVQSCKNMGTSVTFSI
jgi:signal transduction histidine kinase